MPDSAAAPEIPAGGDGLYHGERLDLTQADLGAVLRERLASTRPAERVVLHLAGQGERTTSPVQLAGVKELVLYFEPTQGAPLTLLPNPRSIVNRKALIEVDDGSLEMINARIRFGNSRFTPLPQHMIFITNGNLRLARCRLQGPMENGPDFYESLILYRTGMAREPTFDCDQSVLVSGKAVLSLEGRRLRQRLSNSLIVASRDLFQVDCRPDAGPLKMNWSWDRNTLVARESFVKLVEAPAELSPKQPLLITGAENLFLGRFSAAAEPPALLRASDEAFCQGLIQWRGSKNGFEQKRLQGVSIGPEKAPKFSGWLKLWGPAGEKQPLLLNLPWSKKTGLDPEQVPALERLALPATVVPDGQTPPGADLSRLDTAGRVP